MAKTDDAGDEEELEIVLRPPREVGERIVVVAALCRRAMLELSPEAVDDPEGERFDLAAWIREEGLMPLLSLDERHFLEARIGGVSREEAEDMTWNIERLAVLAWAANLLDALPPLTEQIADPPALLELVPAPWDATQAFIKSVTLRTEEELAAAREAAEVWHWRLTLEPEMRLTTGQNLTQLRSIVRDVAREAADTGVIPGPVAGDFGVDGVPVSRVPLEDLAEIENIVAERLRTLNWLCGFGATWADAPLEID